MARLRRIGLEQPVRYEYQRPRELVHLDIKKLGLIHRGAGKRVGGIKRTQALYRTYADGRERKTVGWDYVHIAIDYYSRFAYADVLADEKASTAICFLRRAIAHYQRHCIQSSGS